MGRSQRAIQPADVLAMAALAAWLVVLFENGPPVSHTKEASCNSTIHTRYALPVDAQNFSLALNDETLKHRDGQRPFAPLCRQIQIHSTEWLTLRDPSSQRYAHTPQPWLRKFQIVSRYAT